MDDIVVQDARTFTIRWNQPYVDAADMHISFQALPRHLLEDDFKTMDAVAFTSHPFWTFQYVGLRPIQAGPLGGGLLPGGIRLRQLCPRQAEDRRMKILIINDPQTAMANVLAGEIALRHQLHVLRGPGPGAGAVWTANGGGTVLYSPTQRRLGPDPDAPRSTSSLRRCPTCASGTRSRIAWIDQERVDVLDGGKGRVALHPGLARDSRTTRSIEKAVLKHTYDPRRAQELMAEAGWTKGSDGFFQNASRRAIHHRGGIVRRDEERARGRHLRRRAAQGRASTPSSTSLPVRPIDDNETRGPRGAGISLRGGGEPYEYYVDERDPLGRESLAGNNRPGWSNTDYNRTLRAARRAPSP